MFATLPDLARLLVLPAFAWVAWRDVRTRRVPNRVWYPLAALGLLLLAVEGAGALADGNRAYFLRVALSVGFVVPLAYGFWWIGGFGGADAKAFMVIAVLYPVYPTYFLPDVALPLVATVVGVFSLTVLSNTVLAGAVYPLGVAATNLARGRIGLPMFLGKPVAWHRIPETHGRLLETPVGFTRAGLDVDALRMYLRYRGLELADLREEPDRLRDPATLPEEPDPPGDGALAADGGTDDGRAAVDADDAARTDAAASGGAETVSDAEPPEAAEARDGDGSPADYDDPWGAAAFLEDIDHSAYGTTPEGLRDGLEVLVAEDEVWLSPGIPFLVPLFVGLVVSLTYGDVLVAVISRLTAPSAVDTLGAALPALAG